MTSDELHLSLIDSLHNLEAIVDDSKSINLDLMATYRDLAQSLLPDDEELDELSVEQRVTVAQVYATLALASAQTATESSIEGMKIQLKLQHADKY